MTKPVILSTRIDSALSQALDELCRDMERSRAWIAATAIKRFVEEEREFLAFIKEGEDDVAAGRTATQEEMEAKYLQKPDRRAAA